MLAPLPADFHADVRARLRDRADAAGLDGLLLLAHGNVTYATGWHFSRNERPVGLWIGTGGTPLLLVPYLEQEDALGVPGVDVRTYEEFPGVTPAVLWMLSEVGARRMAIDTLDAALLDDAKATLDRLDLEDHVRSERSVKTEGELALTREAAHLADQVLERLLAAGGDIIAQGGTEADLLADCTGHVRHL
ncbi:MAG: aminopeptidase P family N-terminal domain-containing protein, partial [Longimicrobiales bacterium]